MLWNMRSLLLYRDIFQSGLNVCSRCGALGAWYSVTDSAMRCVSCWQPDSSQGSLKHSCALANPSGDARGASLRLQRIPARLLKNPSFVPVNITMNCPLNILAL